MASNLIHQEFFDISPNKNRNFVIKELSHLSRFNFNNKNKKLNIIPHSFSQNKNMQYHNQNYIQRIIHPEKINHFYEKENSKKSETNLNTTLNNNIIEIKDLIGKNTNKPLDLNMLSAQITKFNPGKISSKSFGIITSYAANTNQGIVRNYNEDRVSIIINMNKPNNYKSSLPWPKISYFAIFDGHAGNKCAEYLRENLLKLICSNSYFPENIPEAIRFGFEKADEIYLNNYSMVNGQLKDNSGTCGLILLIINNEVYIGNVGDSRCIGSFNNGKLQRDITRDHKPNTIYEKERILANGGQIYQTKTNIKVEENYILKNKILLGPYRVFPGRLSVSRTVGDAEGKIPILGGNPNVIICKPDIYKFNINENDIDYFVLGCDGIYDQLSSKDVFKCVSLVLERNKELLNNNEYNKKEYKSLYGNNIDIHSTCGDAVDLILKAAMIRQSYDNVTCLLVCFKNLLNIDYQISYDNTLENTNNRIGLYSSLKRDQNYLMTSNSNNNYNRTNSNNKKNINIHGISKIIQKLRSGNSDSSLFKKKEEMEIANEASEYSEKPMLNIYIKNYNNNDKDILFSNANYSQSNGKRNIPLDNNHNYSINKNKTFNYREAKINNYLNLKNNENNNDIQVIYKNINPNNFLYNQNNTLKSNTANNTINSLDYEKIEEKKGKLFYNRKKINYNNNIFKRKSENSVPKNMDERDRRKGISIENEKVKKNKTFVISNNSRNLNNNKMKKKNLNLNNFIYTNNNSFKNLYKNEILNDIDDPININNKISSLKKIYINKDEENNIINNKINMNDIKDDEQIQNEIKKNNFLSETKVKSNIVYDNLIRNRVNKMNLFKNIDNRDSVVSVNLNENHDKNSIKSHENNAIIINTNKSSFQTFKAFKSMGIKKIYPSIKDNNNLRGNKKNNAEYNNHKYYYSNNNNNINNSKETSKQKVKEKYDTYSINNKTKYKNTEPRNSNTRNHKELKVKYSSSQVRSNTES